MTNTPSTAGTSANVFSMVGKPLPTSLAGGADIEVVKERLGHSSIVTTQKSLGTLDEVDETAIDALSRTRSRSRTAGIRRARRPA
jgi:hypothetical protein